MTEAIFSGVTSTIIQALVSNDTLIVDQVIFLCNSALQPLRYNHQKCSPFQSMNTPQTRRLTILNADEIEAIFGLPQFTEDERQMHFALTPSESEVVSATNPRISVTRTRSQSSVYWSL